MSIIRGRHSLRLILAVAAAGLSLAGTAATPTAGLRFDDIFATRGEPARLHYSVRFRSGGVAHMMEVWRDADRRIRRNTDAALTVFATHRPGDPAYRLAILDRVKHVRTDIERTNLYRIGQFADWFDLGHGLRHPKGAYRLTAIAAPPAVRPLRPCNWYALAEGRRVTTVCWDGALHIPLMIVGADRQPLWNVTTVDSKPIAEDRFKIDDRNYIRDDADHDIERD